MTSHVLLEAIPNEDRSGIIGAIIARCENFKAIPGTERRIDGIDCINICTGLNPDNQLLRKGQEIFGLACHGVGDAVRIGEGTSAVLRGRQCAYEIMQALGRRINYDEYLTLSKEYIDSQQHPKRILDEPRKPSAERMAERGFVLMDCLYGFACNPCSFACRHGAITKSSTSTVPFIDYDKCIGCMDCVSQCPGLAIFGYLTDRRRLYLPIEYAAESGSEVFLVDNDGQKVGEGIIDRILIKPNRTNVAIVTAKEIYDESSPEDLLKVRGFIVKEHYPEPLVTQPVPEIAQDKGALANTFICHCEDVNLEQLLKMMGNRTSITAQELKHITRIGMGVCRGSRCLQRARQALRNHGIEVIGEFTPRGPMANLVEIGAVSNREGSGTFITSDRFTKQSPVKVGAFVAGGGIAGSATFRYLAEAGFGPVLINMDHGSSWRNIAGGRPAFSLPALADIAKHNLEIFKDLDTKGEIDFRLIRYISFAHDEANYKALESSIAWSDAYMVEKKDFQREISDYFNPNLDIYSHALISNDCWQASPGRTIDLVRHLGIEAGGTVFENTQLVNVSKNGDLYELLVKHPDGKYVRYQTEIFVNALGANAEKFAKQLGIETGLFPVRHQAFITKRLPLLGKNGAPLDMLIDRRKYKGFSAVYGQQLADTGQIIGCASPANDATDTFRNLKVGTREFIEIVAEVFSDWIPQLRGMSFQAMWSGYYIEPRYIVDPARGLFMGMRGHGFMLSQYIAKLYVDSLLGREVPDYFRKLALDGPGLSEQAFK